jgi:hypothetical protein
MDPKHAAAALLRELTADAGFAMAMALASRERVLAWSADAAAIAR